MVLRLVFLIVFFSLLGGLLVFLYRRLVRDVTEHPLLRVGGGLALVALLLSLPLLRLATSETGLPPQWASLGVMLLLGVLYFAVIGLVAVEALAAVRRRWPGSTPRENPVARAPAPDASPVAVAAELAPPAQAPEPADTSSRRVFLARATAAGALAFGGGMTAFGAWRAFTPAAITEVPIRLRNLPRALDGFTIVQLSDIHVGPIIQERFLDHLVETANAAKPDLLAITGDLVDGTPSQLGRYVARLRNLNAKYGRYFVSGNHDYYSGWEDWAPVVAAQGFDVLRNRAVRIGDAQAGFDLVGVEDWGTFRTRAQAYDLDKATAGRDPSQPSVLLAHQPNGLELASAKSIGLQLSGHTHGGQTFPGTIVGELIWGSRNAGLTKLDETFLYTSRGCGFVGPPVRVGAPPEVVKIVLLAA